MNMDLSDRDVRVAYLAEAVLFAFVLLCVVLA